MLERVADGLGGERDVALREVHEREAGLRVPAELVRGAKGLLRATDVAPEQADPAELPQRPAEFAAQVRTQLLTGEERVVLRLAP